MLARFVKVRRRLLGAVAPTLLSLAVAAYFAQLALAHDAAARDETTGVLYRQHLGSEASYRQNALLNVDEGTLFLGSSGRVATGTWYLDALGKNLPNNAAVAKAELFVAGADLEFLSANSVATVFIDGAPAGVLRARASGPEGQAPFVIANALLSDVDNLPQDTRGFPFPLAGDACVVRGCTLRIRTADVRWRVERVGVLLTTRAAGPALWERPPDILGVCLGAAGLAALSHVLLSVRRRTPAAV